MAPKSDVDFTPGSDYAQLVDETTIFTSMISRHFSPDNYKVNDQMDIAAVTSNKFSLSSQFKHEDTI